MAFDRKAYMKEYTKKHYQENKEQYLKSASKWRKENRDLKNAIAAASERKRYPKYKDRYRNKKILAIEYLGGVCARCGGDFHPSVYDIHHTDPSVKTKTPSALLRHNWESVLDELDTCILLCANCHRYEHHAHEWIIDD